MAEKIALDTDLPIFSIVEFPGYLKDPNEPHKALEALGGLEEISNCFASAQKQVENNNILKKTNGIPTKKAVSKSQENALTLRFNSDINFARISENVASGEIVQTCNLLLRIAENSDGTSTVRIAGVILKTGRFRNMMDYQYRLPSNDPVLQLEKVLLNTDWKDIDTFDLANCDKHTSDSVLIASGSKPNTLAIPQSKTFGVPPALFSSINEPQIFGFKQVESSRESRAAMNSSLIPMKSQKPTNVSKKKVNDMELLNEIKATLDPLSSASTTAAATNMDAYIDQLMKSMPMNSFADDTAGTRNPGTLESNDEEEDDVYNAFEDASDDE